MKMIKIIRFTSLAILTVTSSQTSFAAERLYPSLDENLLRNEVVVATNIAEIKIKDAQNVINEARQKALQGTMTSTAVIKIIKEQNAEINKIENALKEKIKQAVKDVKVEEENYLGSFVSGVQDLGAHAIAPFKSGYGYTEEQKATAQKVIDGLMEQQAQLTKDYEEALKKIPSPKVVRPGSEYDVLTKRYKAIIAELNDEIYQQQLITGAEMSTQRKLFWAAVAAGAAVAGIAGISYLLAPGAEITPEVVEEIKEKIIPEVSESVVPEVITGIPVVTPTVTLENIKPDVELERPPLTEVIEAGNNIGLDENEDQTSTLPSVGDGDEDNPSKVTPGEIQKTLQENDMEFIRDEKESLFNLLDKVAADKILEEGEDTRDETEKQLRDFKEEFDERVISAFSEKGAPAVNEFLKDARERVLARYKEEEDQAKAEGEKAIDAKKEERDLDEAVIRMESTYNDIIEEIDNAKKSLFDTFDQVLKMRIQEEGEENRARFTEEIMNMKSELSDEINDKLNSGVDPREIVADIKVRIEDTRSTLDEIAKQIEEARIKQEDEESLNIQRILAESDKKQQELLEAEQTSSTAEALRKSIADTINDEEQPKEQQDIVLTDEDTAPKQPSSAELGSDKNPILTQSEKPEPIEGLVTISDEQTKKDIENRSKRMDILAEDSKEYDRNFMDAYREAVDKNDDEKITFLTKLQQEIFSIEPDVSGESIRSKNNSFMLALRDFEKERELRNNEKNEDGESPMDITGDEK